MCVCVEGIERKFVKEDERGLSKEEESLEGGVSENQVCTRCRCKDTSSRNKVTKREVQEDNAGLQKKVASQGPSPPPRPSY